MLRDLRFLSRDFNPRSLAGATGFEKQSVRDLYDISIHAPSRERPYPNGNLDIDRRISIHAPSRERPACCEI